MKLFHLVLFCLTQFGISYAQTYPPVTVNSENKVGIGTSDPTSLLSVHNTFSPSYALDIFSTKEGLVSLVIGDFSFPEVTGIYSNVSGGKSFNIGQKSLVSSNAINNYGVYSTMLGDSTSYGIYSIIHGGNNIRNKYGVYSSVTGGSANFGSYLNSYGSGASYGLCASAASSEAISYGISSVADGAVHNYGVHSVAKTGDTNNTAIKATATSTGEAISYGADISSESSVNYSYGVRTSAKSDNGVSIGLNATASGGNANYGVLSSVAVDDNSWAGYFVGNSFFSQKVGIGIENKFWSLSVFDFDESAIQLADWASGATQFDGLLITSKGAFYNNENTGLEFYNGFTQMAKFYDNGRLILNATNDASLSADGVLLVGPADGVNLVIDGNELVARNNGSSSDLYLQNNGGDLLLNGGGGLIGVKENSPTAMVHIKQNGSGEEGLAIENDTDSDTWSLEVGENDIHFYFNSVEKARIDDADGSWDMSSDQRLKKDITYIDDFVLDKVIKLKPATYRYIDNSNETPKSLGFIAQEVQNLFPELVSSDEGDFLRLNYNDFSVLAIKAIQELEAENKILYEKLQKLEKTVSSLEKHIGMTASVEEDKK